MSAFDRIQNYSSKQGLNESSDVFDLTKPDGAFLHRVHKSGYKIYNEGYSLKEEYRLDITDLQGVSEEEEQNYNNSLFISNEAYNALDNTLKERYEYKVNFTELHNVLTCYGNQVVNATAGSGKALKNGTGVLTPDGFVPIETLKVGDLVASDDGKFYSVAGVFPQGLKDAYEVRFSDKNSIICSKDHLWNVQTFRQRNRELNKEGGTYWETKSLEDIISNHPLRYADHRHNCYIPMQSEVEFNRDTKLPIDPYLLGVLISRGQLYKNRLLMFKTADITLKHMVSDIISCDFDNLRVTSASNVNKNEYKISKFDRKGRNELRDMLHDLNLLGLRSETKFIPEEYLYADIDSRYDLLSGLLDAVGSWNKSYYVYGTVSERLAKDIIFLCESLGLVVTYNKSCKNKDNTTKYNDLYIINIKPSIQARRLHYCKRLDDQFTECKYYSRRSIRDIVDLKCKYEMTCISVDSPNHLFLTEHFIPTHNTTALTFKIMYDIVTGEAMTIKQIENGAQVRVVNNMWVCTFLKTGAEELESSLVSWQRRLGYSQTANQIHFSTMDAEFKRCLNAMGVSTIIGDSGKLHSLLCKAVDSCNITRKGYPLSKEDYNIISGIVTYCRGRLDNQRYHHPSCKDYEITPTILKLLVDQFAKMRQTEGIMDFEEIMELLYKYLYVTPNPNVQDFVANRYNYIYVDEFQDTSQMAYAILKFYARGKLWINRSGIAQADNNGGLYTGYETKGKIVVVGDTSQCIYSFRGSDSTILAKRFDEDFRPIVCALSTNWRCPSNILNPVISSIHLNEDSAKQVIKSARSGGEFYSYCFPSYKLMVSQLKADIQKDMEDGMKSAILCRTNFDGLIPAFILEEDGRFDFSVSGENMTLNSPLPRKIIGVTSLFTERATPAVKNALQFFCRGDWALKQLLDTLRMNNMSIWQVPIDDIKYSCPDLTDFVESIRDIIIDANGKVDKSREMEALRVIYYKLILDVFNGDSAYSESARAYIETLLYIIENNNFESVYEFLEEVEFLNSKLNGRIKKKNAYIQIATVHEFKGKECDSVYVWNDSEGTFPNSKCDLNVEDQVNEERRVHYIACTRAKKREHIYTLQSKIGMFAKEMDCTFTCPITPQATLKNNGAL